MAANKLEQNYASRAAVEQAVGAKLREIEVILSEAKADPDLYRDGLTATLERVLTHAQLHGRALHPQPLPEGDSPPETAA